MEMGKVKRYAAENKKEEIYLCTSTRLRSSKNFAITVRGSECARHISCFGYNCQMGNMTD
jgi:hypothetical protein